MQKLLFTFLIMLASSRCYPQEKILLLNGNEIPVKDYTIKSEKITFRIVKGEKLKKRKVDRYRVFSLTGSDGKEQIMYEPDTAIDLPVEQMRIFIQGEQAAKLYYNKPGNVIGGIVSGVAGSYFTFYGLPVPLLYATISGRIAPKVRLPADAIYPEQKTDAFREGYQRKAKDIKTKQTLISGLIGFALSVTFLSLYEGNIKF